MTDWDTVRDNKDKIAELEQNLNKLGKDELFLDWIENINQQIALSASSAQLGVLQERIEQIEQKPCMNITRIFTDDEITKMIDRDICNTFQKVLHDKFEKELSELQDVFQKAGVKWDFRLDELNGFITELKENQAYWEKEVVETIKIQENVILVLWVIGNEIINLMNDKIAHNTARLHEINAKEKITEALKKLSGVDEKPDPAKEYRDKTNVWIKKEQEDSKHWHPKEKPEEPLYLCKNCGNEISHVEFEVQKLSIDVRKEDLKYLQFIVENEDFYDDVTPGDYKKIHEIWKRYLNDES